MEFAVIRQRITDSAVDFALNAFWVAVAGAAVTAVAVCYVFWRGLSEKLVWALSASFATFHAHCRKDCCDD